MNKGKKAHPYTRYNSKGRLQLSLKKAGAGFAVENKEIIKKPLGWNIDGFISTRISTW